MGPNCMDLPKKETTSTFADKTANQNHIESARLLQPNLNQIEQWTRKMCIKNHETKLVHIVFTKCLGESLSGTIINQTIPIADNVNYLSIKIKDEYNHKEFSLQNFANTIRSLEGSHSWHNEASVGLFTSYNFVERLQIPTRTSSAR